MACVSDGGRDKEKLKIAHYLGLSSLVVGGVINVISIIIAIILLIVAILAAYVSESIIL